MRRLFQHLQKHIDLAAVHLQHRLLRRREGIDAAEVTVGHLLCEVPCVADGAAALIMAWTSCPSREEKVM